MLILCLRTPWVLPDLVFRPGLEAGTCALSGLWGGYKLVDLPIELPEY